LAGRELESVAILYPPVQHEGRVPVLTQSRIFSFTHSREISIYPLVMAQAATLVSRAGFRVEWLDGIAARTDPEEYWRALAAARPGLAVVETKTAVIRKHWSFIDELKRRLPGTAVALVGDHVTCFPEESLDSCAADYVVTGGDYDVSLVALARHLRGDDVPLRGGTWRREGGKVVSAGDYVHLGDLDSLPWIDRDLTRWELYGEAYLHRPVAYVLSGRGCGGVKGAGVCTFCIWQHAFWRRQARLRDPRDTAREIASLGTRYGVREVFDDNEAGGMWDREWLAAFADEMRVSGAASRVSVASNCRADCLDDATCEAMKRAGYRMLKIGLESGNDETLKRIGKDETVEEIIRGVRKAKEYGFAVMVTAMVGFPWEGEREVRRTLEVARELLMYRAKRGDCVEANVMIPYPGTPLHRMMTDNGWWTIDPRDYAAYGLSKPVVSSPVDPVKWANRLWRLHRAPSFILRSILSVRTWQDMALGLRGIRSLFGHERDYPRG
jgi:anaerobic magnesium-protoporphyrin IX monomethyl ester cyclase